MNIEPDDFQIARGFWSSDWKKLDILKNTKWNASWEIAVAVFERRINARFIDQIDALIENKDKATSNSSGFAVKINIFTGIPKKTLCILRHLCYITLMARGNSGRIVIEVQPEAKRQLYGALALSGSTLKDWFIKCAADYCSHSNQPSLFSLSPIEPNGKMIQKNGSAHDKSNPIKGRRSKRAKSQQPA